MPGPSHPTTNTPHPHTHALLHTQPHLARPRLGRKDGQDAAAGAHIQDHLVPEAALVLHAGVEVGACAGVVLQHVLLQEGKKGVRAGLAGKGEEQEGTVGGWNGESGEGGRVGG